MRIAILNDDFPPFLQGGAGAVAFNLALGLKQAGHDVLVITTVQNTETAGVGDIEGMTVHRLHSNYPVRWRSYLSLFNPQTVAQVWKILQEFRPDVVHAHNIHQHLSYHCLKLARQVGAKVFLTALDALLFHYGKLTEFIDQSNPTCPAQPNYRVSSWQMIRRFRLRFNPLRNLVIRHYLKYVDGILAVSNALKQALDQNGIRDVEVLHNGIAAERWRYDRTEAEGFTAEYGLIGKKVVLCSGRLDWLKGKNQIVAAMTIVRQSVPNAVLLLAGVKGENGAGGGVICTGWISPEKIRGALSSSHVVAVPSIYLDPFPTVVLEAMFCGKPVVATCFGGAQELVVDGQTGYVVDPFDTKTMATKIVELLQNPLKAERMGAAGYERVKAEFSLERQVKLTLRRYSDLTDNRSKG